MITILDSGNNPVITLEQSTVNINLTQEEIDITFVELGVQGPKGPKGPMGPKGEPLEFELLTEQQKLELRGDVGDTSTNYTNLFYSSLLS